MSHSRICVIVPTYREADNLPGLIDKIARVRRDHDLELELLIVDDNSQDGTERIVSRCGHSWVRLMVRTTERGLSSAVLAGMRHADGDVFIVMDADLSHPPEAIPQLLKALQAGADFVIGSRYTQGGSTDDRWGMFRWLNSRVATALARPFTRAKDPMSGFFALRRATFESATNLNPIGYKIGLELLVKCRCRRVEEVPIHFADRVRGQSKLSAREQWRYLQHVGRLLQFSYPRTLVATLCAAVVLSFVMPAAMFLNVQSFYVDETTQLSGLTLNPVEVVRWLGGEDAHRFGVPPDRSPPMSYWAGWAWSQVFGLTERSMRWFGLCCAAGAVALIFLAAHRAWGLRAAVIAGLLAALSPNMIVNGVEIRPYPLFLLFSAGGFYFLIGLFTSPVHQQWRWVLGLALCCMFAMYTHFYGLVLSGALLTAALAMALHTRTRRLPVACAAETVIVAAVGLWPFVSASFAKSGGNSLAELPAASELVRYMYRGLIGHPAMSVNLGVTLIAMAVFGALLLASLTRKARSNQATIALWLALGAGMCVVIAASWLFSAFDPLHPSYNLWRLPAFAIVVASAVGAASLTHRRLATAAAGVLVGCSGYATVQLVQHGSYFANGPHRQIAHLLDQIDEHGLAVVHEQSPDWGSMYFPIRYALGPSIRQFILTPEPSDAVCVRALPDGDSAFDLETLPADRLVVIRAKEQHWKDLAQQIREGTRALPPSALVQALQQSSEWREVQQHRFVSFMAAEVHVFERTPPLAMAPHVR